MEAMEQKYQYMIWTFSTAVVKIDPPLPSSTYLTVSLIGDICSFNSQKSFTYTAGRTYPLPCASRNPVLSNWYTRSSWKQKSHQQRLSNTCWFCHLLVSSKNLLPFISGGIAARGMIVWSDRTAMVKFWCQYETIVEPEVDAYRMNKWGASSVTSNLWPLRSQWEGSFPIRKKSNFQRFFLTSSVGFSGSGSDASSCLAPTSFLTLNSFFLV